VEIWIYGNMDIWIHGYIGSRGEVLGTRGVVLGSRGVVLCSS